MEEQYMEEQLKLISQQLEAIVNSYSALVNSNSDLMKRLENIEGKLVKIHNKPEMLDQQSPIGDRIEARSPNDKGTGDAMEEQLKFGNQKPDVVVYEVKNECSESLEQRHKSLEEKIQQQAQGVPGNSNLYRNLNCNPKLEFPTFEVSTTIASEMFDESLKKRKLEVVIESELKHKVGGKNDKFVYEVVGEVYEVQGIKVALDGKVNIEFIKFDSSHDWGGVVVPISSHEWQLINKQNPICLLNGGAVEALDLFYKMNQMELKLDKYSLASVISACVNISSLELGEQEHKGAVWSYCLDSNVPLAEVDDSPDPVRSVAWLHSDQSILSSCSDSGEVRLWNVRSKKIVRTLETKSLVTSTKVSQDGRYITIADGATANDEHWLGNMDMYSHNSAGSTSSFNALHIIEFLAYWQSFNFQEMSGCFCQEAFQHLYVSIDKSVYGVFILALSFLLRRVKIRSSCKELVLCQEIGDQDGENKYYICQLTNGEYHVLPETSYYHGSNAINMMYNLPVVPSLQRPLHVSYIVPDEVDPRTMVSIVKIDVLEYTILGTSGIRGSKVHLPYVLHIQQVAFIGTTMFIDALIAAKLAGHWWMIIEMKILIFDPGGGTFDESVIKYPELVEQYFMT